MLVGGWLSYSAALVRSRSAAAAVGIRQRASDARTQNTKNSLLLRSMLLAPPHLIDRPVLCDLCTAAGLRSHGTLKSDLFGTKPGWRFAFGSGSEPNSFFIQPAPPSSLLPAPASLAAVPVEELASAPSWLQGT